MPRNWGSSVFPWHSTIYYSGQIQKRFTSHLVRLIVRLTQKQMLPLPGGTFSKCCASRPRPRWWWSWWHTSCCTKCGNELHYGPERHWELGPCVSESSATGWKNSEGFHTARLVLNSSNKRWKATGTSPRLQSAVSLECQPVLSGYVFYWTSSQTEMRWQILLIWMAKHPLLWQGQRKKGERMCGSYCHVQRDRSQWVCHWNCIIQPAKAQLRYCLCFGCHL